MLPTEATTTTPKVLEHFMTVRRVRLRYPRLDSDPDSYSCSALPKLEVVLTGQDRTRQDRTGQDAWRKDETLLSLKVPVVIMCNSGSASAKLATSSVFFSRGSKVHSPEKSDARVTQSKEASSLQGTRVPGIVVCVFVP